MIQNSLVLSQTIMILLLKIQLRKLLNIVIFIGIYLVIEKGIGAIQEVDPHLTLPQKGQGFPVIVMGIF